MNLIEELTSIKKGFIDKDRRRAKEAFMEKLYYEIAPCVEFGDTAELFKDDSGIERFCIEKEVDKRAFKWLLDELINEGLLLQNSSIISLTVRGIAKLCLGS